MTEQTKTDLTFRHALLLALAPTAFTAPFVWALVWRLGLSWRAYVLGPATVFCFALGVALWRFVQEERDWLWAAERIFAKDINADGFVGKPPDPEPDPEPPIIYAHDGGKKRRQEERARDFHYWLRGAYGQLGTTWDAWKGQTLPSGEQIQQAQWERWCDRLLKANLAGRPYPTSTLKFTSDYLDALRAFADLGHL